LKIRVFAISTRSQPWRSTGSAEIDTPPGPSVYERPDGAYGATSRATQEEIIQRIQKAATKERQRKQITIQCQQERKTKKRREGEKEEADDRLR
jgi:hypothetical protein